VTTMEPFARLVEALRREGQLLAAPDPVPLTGIADDSRRVAPGDLFLAMPGTRTDGSRFIEDALARGARLVLTEAAEVPSPRLLVRDARRGARIAARAWYREPTMGLTLVGVTGTNGKTTTTALIRHLLNEAEDAASLGTLGAYDGHGDPVPSTAGALTTPGALDLQATFAELRRRGARRVVLEASSHSLDQARLDDVAFAGAVFTNLTREHLDYHGTMERYLAAKLRLTALLAPDGVAAVNADDPAWAAVRAPRVLRFGLVEAADLQALMVNLRADGSTFQLSGRFGTRPVRLPIPGAVNVANALAASAIAVGLGVTLDVVAKRLATAPQVPGRMELLADTPCTVLRDYAHTPDAFERLLTGLRPLTQGRLMLLFGCGGDRDRGKRPIMGRIAAELADQVFLTSDNPRTEDPDRIVEDIVSGMPGAAPVCISDRREAIAAAIATCRTGDTLVLAGKGHETYQLVGTKKQAFDERAIVREITGT